MTVPQYKDELRRLQESAESFRPMRIMFDTSKLDRYIPGNFIRSPLVYSDPDYMCTREGQIIRSEGNDNYQCSKDDVLTAVGGNMNFVDKPYYSRKKK